MKYICAIGGFVYNEAKEPVLFSALPDTWICPVCGARKNNFHAEEDKKKPQEAHTIYETDLQPLSTAQLSALCSNLARGCEKQYKFRESELYTQLSEYFLRHTPQEPEASLDRITALLKEDLNEGYKTIHRIASDVGDRGALRVCVWGEKVTRILHDLMERYATEGEQFLADTNIWVCSICGFVYVGNTAPMLCPVCKVPDWKFEKIEGGIGL